MRSERRSKNGAIDDSEFAIRRTLLACGFVAAILYAATNAFVPLLDPSYSPINQTVSELSAIGAPTRWLWFILGTLYTGLIIAFGFGVQITARRSTPIYKAGSVLIFFGIVGMFWPPMHLRGVETTLTDTLHIAWTLIWGVGTLLAMTLFAVGIGKVYAKFTFVSMIALIGFGFMTSLQAPHITSNLPTPTIGIWERANIAVFILWLAVTSLNLLLREDRIQNLSHARSRSRQVQGYVARGFEPVYDAFVENFLLRDELGGACCIYRHGEKVVDLWGGVRDAKTNEPWDEHTLVTVYSTSKGMAAMALALAHSRGWISYDERVATYWPEFAQNGKENITVRQLLGHQAGLFAFDERVDREVLQDLDRLAATMARQKPAWEPGTRQAYHAITLGFYEGELIRRVDPQHRSLGQFFQDEIATPLELEFYIRIPRSLPNSRLAVLDQASPLKAILGLPLPLMLASVNPRSAIFRALLVNPGSSVVLDKKTVMARELEVPSGGGVGTARSIARAYSALMNLEIGFRQQTLDALIAPAVPPTHGFFDEALRGEVEFSLGFAKPNKNWPFGHAGAFGSPGAGGSLGYADPKRGIAYAYVTNRMGGVDSDPRDLALRAALETVTDVGSQAGLAPEGDLFKLR